MELKVDNFIIQLHRAEETSHEEEVKRLATYVSTICELGLKQEKYTCISITDNVAVATERGSKCKKLIQVTTFYKME